MSSIPLYDADGNQYFVATPSQIRELVDVDLPASAAEAAISHKSWATKTAARICAGSRNDGLLIGPFPAEDGCGLLILNTDGSLAEFSGNGVAIFSQFLVAKGDKDRSRTFFVNVHHPRSKPLRVEIEPIQREGSKEFLIYMNPTFGPEPVHASVDRFASAEFNGRAVSRVFALSDIDSAWTCSQFVRVGNPHCVTFVKTVNALPPIGDERSNFTARLTSIAYSSVDGECKGDGLLCENGINLQWAFVLQPDEARSIEGSPHILGRVFERGVGWTESSGSSATAVASAARQLGVVSDTTVRVKMPGGSLSVSFAQGDANFERVMLSREAHLVRFVEF
jgi:diaminopimelate epimerase